MRIGSFINQARKNLGLSREILAEKIGVSTSTIMRWENDKMKPSFDLVVKLSKALCVPVGYFAGESSSIKEEKVAPIQTAIPKNLFEAAIKHASILELMAKLPSDDSIFEDIEGMLEDEISCQAESLDGSKKA